jgi:hypothetical protein
VTTQKAPHFRLLTTQKYRILFNDPLVVLKAILKYIHISED